MNHRAFVASRDRACMAVLEPAEVGGWMARFPALDGLVAEDDTVDDARAKARASLRCIDGNYLRCRHISSTLAIPKEFWNDIRTEYLEDRGGAVDGAAMVPSTRAEHAASSTPHRK